MYEDNIAPVQHFFDNASATAPGFNPPLLLEPDLCTKENVDSLVAGLESDDPSVRQASKRALSEMWDTCPYLRDLAREIPPNAPPETQAVLTELAKTGVVKDMKVMLELLRSGQLPEPFRHMLMLWLLAALADTDTEDDLKIKAIVAVLGILNGQPDPNGASPEEQNPAARILVAILEGRSAARTPPPPRTGPPQPPPQPPPRPPD